MRSGNPLHNFACRFVVRVLRHEFSANGEVKNLLVDLLARIHQVICCCIKQVSNHKQLFDFSDNTFLFGERR